MTLTLGQIEAMRQRGVWRYQAGGPAGSSCRLDFTSDDAEQLLDAAKLAVRLEERLAVAMRFVPIPQDMSGYGEPDAPDAVQELIAAAKWLHGEKI